jgi:hypothetical protein
MATTQAEIDRVVMRCQRLVARYDGDGQVRALAKVRWAYRRFHQAPGDAMSLVLLETELDAAETEASSLPIPSTAALVLVRDLDAQLAATDATERSARARGEG